MPEPICICYCAPPAIAEGCVDSGACVHAEMHQSQSNRSWRCHNTLPYYHSPLPGDTVDREPFSKRCHQLARQFVQSLVGTDVALHQLDHDPAESVRVLDVVSHGGGMDVRVAGAVGVEVVVDGAAEDIGIPVEGGIEGGGVRDVDGGSVGAGVAAAGGDVGDFEAKGGDDSDEVLTAGPREGLSTGNFEAGSATMIVVGASVGISVSRGGIQPCPP